MTVAGPIGRLLNSVSNFCIAKPASPFAALVQPSHNLS